MKNLKKLAVMSAIFASSNFAHAQEKEFTPMGTAEEIDSIELVNGQIMVRPTDTTVPYYFVGTNTTDFASRAFAHPGMTNLTSEVLTSDAVWATRGNKLMKFPFEKNALNNVPTKMETNNLNNVSKVISVNGNDALVIDTNENLVNYNIQDGKATTNNQESLSYKNGDDSYEAKLEETFKIKIYKNGRNLTYWNETKSQPKSLVAFGDKQIYLLTKDGKLYTNNASDKNSNGLSDTPIMSDVQSLIPAKDGKGYIVAKKDGSVISYTLADNGKTSEDVLVSATKVASKEFTTNGIRYYAIGKKLGYEK